MKRTNEESTLTQSACSRKRSIARSDYENVRRVAAFVDIHEFDEDNELENWSISRIVSRMVETDSDCNEIALTIKDLLYACAVIPESICDLSCLQSLTISDCNIHTLPDHFSRLRELKFLSLERLPVLTQLPQDIGSLERIKEVRLYDLPRLTFLPDSFCDLSELERLHLTYVPNLRQLPLHFHSLSNLNEWKMKGTPVEVLPSLLPSPPLKNFKVELSSVKWGLVRALEGLGSLETLDMGEKPISADLTPVFSELRNLKVIKCHPTVPHSLAKAPCGPACLLRELKIKCHLQTMEESQQLPPCLNDVRRLWCLTKLYLRIQFSCLDQITLPHGMLRSLPNLQKLYIAVQKNTAGQSNQNLYLNVDEFRYSRNLKDLFLQEIDFVSNDVDFVSPPESNRVLFDCLEILTLARVDGLALQHLYQWTLSNLKTFEILECADLDDKCFKGLTDYLFDQSKKIEHLNFAYCNITELLPPSVEVLSSFDLKSFEVTGNPIADESLDERLGPLVKACTSLSCVGVDTSLRMAHDLCLGAARTRILNRQKLARSCWPLILSRASMAFVPHASQQMSHVYTLSSEDAIYTLLKERAAEDLFFESSADVKRSESVTSPGQS